MAPSAADSRGLTRGVTEAAGKANNPTGAAPHKQSEKCQLKQFFAFYLQGREVSSKLVKSLLNVYCLNFIFDFNERGKEGGQEGEKH